MKNIIIKTNNEQLSDAEIEQFKNFDQLLDQYQQASPKTKGRLSTPKIVIIVTIAGLGAATAALLLFKTPNQPVLLQTDSLQGKEAFINPPIPQADVPMVQYAVDNRRDTTLNLPSGTKISIPAQSLLLDGKPASCTDIQLSVREMKTVDEVFLSGIPMDYDSANTRYTFETAGMMQIEAQCNGRALSIDPRRPLRVAMSSPSASRDFNLYQLDTNKRAWQYRGKDSVVAPQGAKTARATSNTDKRLEQLKRQLEKIVAELAALQKNEPRAPEIANTAEWSIQLDVLPNEFPELRSFKEQLFEIDSRFKPLKKTDQAKNWEEVRLEQSAYPGRYWIKFNAFKDSCRYLVKPVFPKALFAKAKVVFDSSFKAYKKQLAARLKTEDSLKLAIAKEQKRVSDSVRKVISKSFEKRLEEQNRSAEVINSIYRYFEVNQFGFWNCDRPLQSNETVVTATFRYQDLKFGYSTCYIVTKSINSVFTFYLPSNIRYDAHRQTVAWIVSGDDIYYVTADEFQQQITVQPRPVLQLQKASKPILSAADFKAVYNNEILR